MLSEQQIAFYHEHGYIVVENVLSEAELTTLRADCDALVAQASVVSQNNEVYDLEDSHSAAQPRVRRIKDPHRWMASAKALYSHPKIVSILTCLMGENVRFQVSKLNMKAAEYGAAVEWHQDWAFYPHTNQNLLAAGLMIDDMKSENGPLMVIPGSHKGPIYDHHSNGYFCGAIDLETCDIDFSKAVELTGPAGSVSFHHVRAVHGSAVNRSTMPRRLLLYQYTAVDAWPLVQGVDDIDQYDKMIISGRATLYPRLEDVPVRLPLPPAPCQGSIYENQRTAGQRFFEQYEESKEEALNTPA